MSHATLAAVDLGSNSFHLQIARVVDHQLFPLDSLKDTVRLGNGVTPDRKIDAKTAERALATLRLFAERIRGMPRDAVRIVGTNALRIAKNAEGFVREAEGVLGFPIEVISGREEARLIYLGVAHSLPPQPHNRLVVDIGGGSTEFIIGHRMRAKVVDSLYMGCVTYSGQFFDEGEFDKKRLKDAQFAARKEIEQIKARFQKESWQEAIGSSGTARALAAILEENGIAAHGISREGLEWLRDKALKAGNLNQLALPGVKSDRVPVLAGGLAIMLTVFEELSLKSMEVVDTALRDGVLYDLLGRTQHEDIRAVTVDRMAKRYHSDLAQATRVENLALRFFDRAVRGKDSEDAFQNRQVLSWACRLHEIGVAIAQAGFHKHSAYIVGNADMPGFSRREQAALAALLLAQRGKLAKVTAGLLSDRNFQAGVICLRLAVLLSRSRRNIESKLFSLFREGGKYRLEVDPKWLAGHDLTDYELKQEAAEWAGLGIEIALADA
ncbi:MAG: exopolyphosphatase [Betaproteobacteria bacterium]|nr:exopolyphosphatase [Betaproteobacteria bacterium]